MSVSMHPVIGFVSLIWAIIASGMLYYFWRKSSGLYALLVEGAGRYEEMRLQNRSLEASMQAADQKMSAHRQDVSRVQEELAATRRSMQNLNEKLSAKELELNTVREKLEGQKRHLERELAKVQTSFDAMVAERNGAAENLKDLQDRVKKDKADFEKRLAQTTADLKAKEIEFLDLKAKFDKVDPVEIIKTKRKIHHYERLYQSMKGLREMADERNRNWEVALRKLSHWILAESGCVKRQGAVPAEIGPLVGQALQAIGAQLIEDGEMDMAALSKEAVNADSLGEHG